MSCNAFCRHATFPHENESRYLLPFFFFRRRRTWRRRSRGYTFKCILLSFGPFFFFFLLMRASAHTNGVKFFNGLASAFFRMSWIAGWIKGGGWVVETDFPWLGFQGLTLRQFVDRVFDEKSIYIVRCSIWYLKNVLFCGENKNWVIVHWVKEKRVGSNFTVTQLVKVPSLIPLNNVKLQ